MACSLAWVPYCTVIDESTRAVSDPRGEGDELPVYQATVVAEPLTSELLLLETRSGGCTADMGEELKPSELSAAEFELVMFRLAALSLLNSTTPPLTVDGVDVPVIVSTAPRSVLTVAVFRSM